VDPLAPDFPENSTYSYAENSPAVFIDFLGEAPVSTIMEYWPPWISKAASYINENRKGILSTALDILPATSNFKNVIQLFTGRDLITGEPINRLEAAIGILPFGKVITRAVNYARKSKWAARGFDFVKNTAIKLMANTQRKLISAQHKLKTYFAEKKAARLQRIESRKKAITETKLPENSPVGKTPDIEPQNEVKESTTPETKPSEVKLSVPDGFLSYEEFHKKTIISENGLPHLVFSDGFKLAGWNYGKNANFNITQDRFDGMMKTINQLPATDVAPGVKRFDFPEGGGFLNLRTKTSSQGDFTIDVYRPNGAKRGEIKLHIIKP
jgi:hypothetical protein